MKGYLVETFNERLKNCGLLLGQRSFFTARIDAKKFIVAEKRRLSDQPYRLELWEIETRDLNAERLAELIILEDIWVYLVNRKEKLEEHKK